MFWGDTDYFFCNYFAYIRAFFFFFLTDLTLNVFYGIFLVFRVFFFLSIIVEFSERKFGIIEVGLHQTHNTCAQRCRDVLRAARKC